MNGCIVLLLKRLLKPREFSFCSTNASCCYCLEGRELRAFRTAWVSSETRLTRWAGQIVRQQRSAFSWTNTDRKPVLSCPALLIVNKLAWKKKADAHQRKASYIWKQKLIETKSPSAVITKILTTVVGLVCPVTLLMSFSFINLSFTLMCPSDKIRKAWN